MSFRYKETIDNFVDEIKEIVNKIGVTPEQAMSMLELVEKRKNNSLLEQQNQYMRTYIKDKTSAGTWILLDAIDKELGLSNYEK